MDLDIRHEMIGVSPMVRLAGAVDLSTVPTLHDRLRDVIRTHPGRTILVDLDGVTGLDDAGLGILLGAASRARDQGGDLTLVTTSPRLRERFRTTGLDRAVTVREP